MSPKCPFFRGSTVFKFKFLLEQIRDAKARTKDMMDDLIQENSQLRKKLMLKSEELSEYRSSVESANSKVIRNYKEKVTEDFQI